MDNCRVSFYDNYSCRIFPQIIELIQNKSSYGISGLSVFGQVIGPYLTLYNLVCLKFGDFCGLLQYPITKTFPRFLTIINFLLQSLFFTPVIFLVLIYHDKIVRPERTSSDVKKDRLNEIVFVILSVVTILFLVFIWLILGITKGFACDAIQLIGEIAGTLSSFTEIPQYLPQIYMTIKYKDSGSYSLWMLGILAPTNMANTFFMAFGQKEHWTTYIDSFVDASLGFFLLAICLYYRRKKKPTDIETELLSIETLNAQGKKANNYTS